MIRVGGFQQKRQLIREIILNLRHVDFIQSRYWRSCFYSALALISAFLFEKRLSNSTASVTVPSFGPESESFQCKPGSWGNLEYTKKLVMPPEEFFQGDCISSAKPKWILKNFSNEKLLEFFKEANLDKNQHEAILSSARFETSINGFIITPSKSLVLTLNPSQRSTIYSALSSFSGNDPQTAPYYFHQEWLNQSGLSEETISLVSKLVYNRGNSLLFSDVDQVLPLLKSSNERKRFIRTVYGHPSLSITLHIDRDTDLASLTNYWGRGTDPKKLYRLLEEQSKVCNGQINVVDLLPAFARQLIHTYQPLDSSERLHDCHWTSLNFFKDIGSTTETDSSSKYDPIEGQPTFGDVVILIDNHGIPIHSAVFIADDIFFTKNGSSHLQPWIFMKFEDILAKYSSNTQLGFQFYRYKYF